ncbi:PREDICTED: normal mucosa of esophagus-specific gene 1 protein isoform X2 [Ficedula albicollis]|uniref:normal mucosa of esophagus-specific gene 1 protein isoform X2 n=1 Tax=Ficedula albicollis TaxID=59894 RepID=UPI000359A78B|nr:PREDICTED: normal mucosa of esophagus-specific gene 1 protein isoform X2 [Ficedula albicollis]XP_016156339.1 PREDICTED: normal mucosa of esophagus-specific gene 1 protein isoform X2 [Ficedula albicollis]
MSKGFWHTLKRQKELIPLLGILSMAATGAVSFCIYSLLNKSDVIIRKIGSSEPWEKVDPTKPQKLVTINQKWEPIEELETVKKLTK